MSDADPITDELAAALSSATAGEMRGWARALWDGQEPDREEFAQRLAAAMLVAYLGGLGVKPTVKYAEQAPMFKEALDALRRKSVVLGVNSPREVDERLLQTAFFVSGVTAENLVDQIRRELMRVREAGLTRDTFIAGVNKITELSGDHLDIVWRTNLASAAAAGRWAQYHAPAVEGMYVAYEWRSLRVPGTRPLHRAMHLFVAASDDPIWRVVWPPCGYRCLCTVLPLTAERARAAGFTGRRVYRSELQRDVVDAAEAGFAIEVEGRPTLFPDKGFRGNALRGSLID